MLTKILNRPLRAFAPAVVLCLLAGQTLADGPEIARLAPERSIAIVSIPDWQQLRTSFDASAMGRLWKEPVIAGFFERASKDHVKRFKELLETVRVDLEDLKHPTGHLGAALFTAERGERPNEDPHDDSEPHFLLVAEFGEHADDWQQLIDRFVDRGLDDRSITLEDDTYRDAKITIIKPVYDEHRGHGHDEEDEKFDLGDALGGSVDHPRNLHLTRLGGTMLFSTELRALETAIDRMNGEGRDALAESAIYRDALAQHDRQTLAHALFFTQEIFRDMDDDNSFGPSPKMIFDLTGMTAVKAIGASLRIDTSDAVAHLNISALAREKKGILELMDESAGAFEPPAFVGPDVASVMRGTFRFDKVLDFARTAVQSFPADERDQASAMIEQGAGIVGPALAAMGPIFHIVTTHHQPYAADSSHTTWIIDVSDELTVNNTLAFVASSMGGMLESRDFEGTVIYSAEFPFSLSMAVDLGRLFIGSGRGVESALRAAGRPDAPRLADERNFRDAVRALSTNSVIYSFMDIEQYLRRSWWEFENAEKIMADSLARIGLDDEYRDEMIRRHRENIPEWQKDLPPVDAITRHIGDMVYELRSTADGYTARLLLLKPREDDR